MITSKLKGDERNEHKFLDKFKNDMEKMKAQVNATVSGFAGLFNKTMTEGVLSVKEKELVAIGIAVAKQCEPCIILHVQKCRSYQRGNTGGCGCSGNDERRSRIYAYTGGDRRH